MLSFKQFFLIKENEQMMFDFMGRKRGRKPSPEIAARNKNEQMMFNFMGRKRGRKFNPEITARNKKIVDFYNQGKGYTQIANEMGMNKNLVNTILVGAAKKGLVSRATIKRGKPERNKQIIDLYNQGDSIKNIANKVGARKRAVVYVLTVARKKGLISSERRKRGRKPTPENIARNQAIIDSYNQGKTIIEIANDTGIRYPTVASVIYAAREKGIVSKFIKRDKIMGRSPKIAARNKGIVDSYIQGKSFEEIAHETGISVRNVKQILGILRRRGLISSKTRKPGPAVGRRPKKSYPGESGIDNDVSDISSPDYTTDLDPYTSGIALEEYPTYMESPAGEVMKVTADEVEELELQGWRIINSRGAANEDAEEASPGVKLGDETEWGESSDDAWSRYTDHIYGPGDSVTRQLNHEFSENLNPEETPLDYLGYLVGYTDPEAQQAGTVMYIFKHPQTNRLYMYDIPSQIWSAVSANMSEKRFLNFLRLGTIWHL